MCMDKPKVAVPVDAWEPSKGDEVIWDAPKAQESKEGVNVATVN